LNPRPRNPQIGLQNSDIAQALYCAQLSSEATAKGVMALNYLMIRLMDGSLASRDEALAVLRSALTEQLGALPSGDRARGFLSGERRLLRGAQRSARRGRRRAAFAQLLWPHLSHAPTPPSLPHTSASPVIPFQSSAPTLTSDPSDAAMRPQHAPAELLTSSAAATPSDSDRSDSHSHASPAPHSPLAAPLQVRAAAGLCVQRRSHAA